MSTVLRFISAIRRSSVLTILNIRITLPNGQTVSPDQTFSGWAELLKRLGSPRKARNYAEKQAAISGRTVNAIANDYLDYINMAKKLRYNLAHEIFYKPKDLETAHDECVRVIREQKWEIQARGVEEKFPEVNGILESITDKYEYIGDEYRIVVPKGIVDILKEGQALGHCVDTSDRYFERIEQRTTYIVFLRKNDCPEQPYYTLEIQPSGTVRQQRTTKADDIAHTVVDRAIFVETMLYMWQARH